MLGVTITSVGLIVNKWWWRVLFITVLGYCIWLFASTIDAHLTDQMNFWSQNLGM